jgi:NtrC-family two-component system sensor histidine kinase KinB
MFRTLRTKLLIGLTPLLAIIVGLGLWAIVMFSRLGNKIDVILKENYASVLAAEGMKEALERIDSALLFAIGGEEQTGRDQFAEYRPVFERNLKIEQGNVTLPGEQQMVDALAKLYTHYLTLTDRLFALPVRPRANGLSKPSSLVYIASCKRDVVRRGDAWISDAAARAGDGAGAGQSAGG